MAEFTGERVIPELVEPELLNEHLARYRFAARYVEGAAVLDAGCGTGYGSASMVTAKSVIGVDVAAEAVGHARVHYEREGLGFMRASCEALPFADGAFNAITAFEVIEHLTGWQVFLAESKRVLQASGVLIVSTPNRSYYAEARGESGPNPFHVHEFEYEEFDAALRVVFPHVRIWTQNRNECFVFAPPEAASGVLEAAGDTAASDAHFFIAICSGQPIPVAETFAWLPSSGNLLWEREQHIAKLQGELQQKDAWLRKTVEDHATLQRSHEELNAELERQNEWSEKLDLDIRNLDIRIGELQDELGKRLGWVRELEEQIERARAQIAQLDHDVKERTAWARSIETNLNREMEEQLARAQAYIAQLNHDLEERTAWARSLETNLGRDLEERTAWARSIETNLGRELEERTAWARSLETNLNRELVARTEWARSLEEELQQRIEQLRQFRRSRWVQLGRKLGAGPSIDLP